MHEFPGCLGDVCSKEYNRIMESQWWSQERLATESFLSFQRIVSIAYEHVPYYRKVFDRRGISPDHIQTPEDTALVPLLSKDDLRSHFALLKSTAAGAQKARIERTSGSSGTSVEFLLSEYVDDIEYAYLWRHWNWAGFDYGDRAVVIRGLRFGSSVVGRPPYMVDRKNGRRNLYISSYHLNEANLHYYLQLMARFRPKIMRVLPSTLDLLTRFASMFGYQVPSVQSIITASETLVDSVRDRASRFWQCPVFDWYGQRERVAAIGQCGEGIYHVNPEYSYVELQRIDRDLYEIVGTSFNNEVMPLIRYRTGDLVTRSVSECSCGRGLPALDKIEGRTSQMLLSTDGCWLFPNALQHVLEPCLNIRMAQVRQREQGHLEVRIVPTDAFDDKDKRHLELSIWDLLGSDTDIDFRFVSDIEPGRTGKRPVVVSDLRLPFA